MDIIQQILADESAPCHQQSIDKMFNDEERYNRDQAALIGVNEYYQTATYDDVIYALINCGKTNVEPYVGFVEHIKAYFYPRKTLTREDLILTELISNEIPVPGLHPKDRYYRDRIKLAKIDPYYAMATYENMLDKLIDCATFDDSPYPGFIDHMYFYLKVGHVYRS